ncbi:hypothetical protein DMJ13_18255 [halophilic archaeon]|nr:hypothetical protein DMJ13_18255 [halophilic archaeon]
MICIDPEADADHEVLPDCHRARNSCEDCAEYATVAEMEFHSERHQKWLREATPEELSHDRFWNRLGYW